MNYEAIYNIFIEIINSLLSEEGETNEKDNNLLPLLNESTGITTSDRQL